MLASPILTKQQLLLNAQDVRVDFVCHAHRLFPKMNSRIMQLIDEPGNNCAPYHNAHHMMSVANAVMKVYEGVESTYRQRTIFLAAAFHDYHHSGGYFTDSFNIYNALQLFMPQIVDGAPQFDLGSMDDLMYDFGTDEEGVQDILYQVVSLIRNTEFPYLSTNTIGVEPMSPLLRDMDRLSCECPDWYDQIYCRLFREQQVSNPTLTFNEFCWGQVQFVSTMPLYSSLLAGKKLVNAIKNARFVASIVDVQDFTDPMELVHES